jgi:NTP pyrophosphatase (non-canonical NTP hydrolase)
VSALQNQLDRYLLERQHNLSTAHLTGFDLLETQAEYVLSEAQELLDAVRDARTRWPEVVRRGRVNLLEAIRAEIADVALADTAFAMLLEGCELPGGWEIGLVTVEGCIREKIEADRGRG